VAARALAVSAVLARWGWLAPLCLAAALYAPALRGGLVWDDETVQHRQLAAFDGVRDVFFPPRGIHEWASAYYRPMVTLSYLLDRRLFGADGTVGPHASAVLLHLIATVLVWLLARRALAGRRGAVWGALGAAAVFAAHPIHTESVCWITGRSDPLATVFVLGSVLVALRWRDGATAWALAAAPLLFLAALLAKEVAISALLVVPLALALVPAAPATARPPAAWLPLAGGYALATALYAVLRQESGTSAGAPIALEPAVLLGRLAAALGWYARKLVVPPPQTHFVPGFPEATAAAVGVAGVAVAVGLAGWRLHRGSPAPLLAVGWGLATLLPSLAVVTRALTDTPLAERYLYLPSVGLALGAGAVLAAALERRAWRVPAAAASVAVVAVYALWTAERCAVWRDDLSLWTDATVKAPEEGLPWNNRGIVLMRMGRLDEAVADFERALAVRYPPSGRAMAHNNVGVVRLRQGRLDEAEVAFQAALGFRRQYDSPYYGLGSVALARAAHARDAAGRTDGELLQRAARLFQFALAVNPHHVRALAGVAEAQLQLARQATTPFEARRARLAARAALERVARLDARVVVAGRPAREQMEALDAELRAAGG
jgi:tetratricopeptide (TPR) repeat protein